MNGIKAKKRTKVILFMILSMSIILFSLIAPYIMPNDPMQTHAELIRIAPNVQFPLGTDSLGRCVMSRLFLGARISIFSAIILVFVSFSIGVSVGIISGYFGGKLDNVMMRIVDLLLAFPEMVLAIAFAGVLGGSLVNAMLAIILTSWTGYARLARSYTLSLKNDSFISASRLFGLTDMQIIKRHIIPNMMSKLLIYASMQLGIMMISIAGLSFLGLGVIPPDTEWGSMLSEARNYIQLAPWATIAPAVAIFISVLIFNGLGEAIKDYNES